MQRFLFSIPVGALLVATAACGGRETPEPHREPVESVATQLPAMSRAGLEAAPAATPRETAATAVPGGTTVGAAERPATPPVPAGSLQSPAPQQAATKSNDAAAILARAERAWGGVRSFRADFTQHLSVPLMGSEQRSRGQILHRRPDRFLMKFSDPAGDILVADGQHFWMYYPSVDRTQVLRSPISAASGQMDLQREFLNNPTARYVVTLAGQETVGGRPAHLLTLVPKAASPYRLLKVWVDQGDHLVRRFEVTEENESVRRVELSNLQVNPELADSQFRFAPPAGTQVFDQ